jgi:hypothetical protein
MLTRTSPFLVLQEFPHLEELRARFFWYRLGTCEVCDLSLIGNYGKEVVLGVDLCMLPQRSLNSL